MQLVEFRKKYFKEVNDMKKKTKKRRQIRIKKRRV